MIQYRNFVDGHRNSEPENTRDNKLLSQLEIKLLLPKYHGFVIEINLTIGIDIRFIVMYCSWPATAKEALLESLIEMKGNLAT
jgi:hypothetical protein